MFFAVIEQAVNTAGQMAEGRSDGFAFALLMTTVVLVLMGGGGYLSWKVANRLIELRQKRDDGEAKRAAEKDAVEAQLARERDESHRLLHERSVATLESMAECTQENTATLAKVAETNKRIDETLSEFRQGHKQNRLAIVSGINAAEAILQEDRTAALGAVQDARKHLVSGDGN